MSCDAESPVARTPNCASFTTRSRQMFFGASLSYTRSDRTRIGHAAALALLVICGHA